MLGLSHCSIRGLSKKNGCRSYISQYGDFPSSSFLFAAAALVIVPVVREPAAVVPVLNSIVYADPHHYVPEETAIPLHAEPPIDSPATLVVPVPAFVHAVAAVPLVPVLELIVAAPSVAAVVAAAAAAAVRVRVRAPVPVLELAPFDAVAVLFVAASEPVDVDVGLIAAACGPAVEPEPELEPAVVAAAEMLAVVVAAVAAAAVVGPLPTAAAEPPPIVGVVPLLAAAVVLNIAFDPPVIASFQQALVFEAVHLAPVLEWVYG